MLRKLPLLLVVGGCRGFFDADQDPPPSIEQPPEAADAAATPAELVIFVDTVPDCDSQVATIGIDNLGDLPLEVLSFTGPSEPQFVLDAADAVPATVDGRSSWRAEIRFAPDAMGTFTDEVVIETDDGEVETHIVELSGTAVDPATAHHSVSRTQTEAVPLDILWVADFSGSVAAGWSSVESYIARFITALAETDIDYRIAVVTTDMDHPDHSGRIQPPGPMDETSMDGENALIDAFMTAVNPGELPQPWSRDERVRDAAFAALTAPLVDDDNAGFLRSDANLAVVTLAADEDASVDISVADFSTWLDGLTADPESTAYVAVGGPRTTLATDSCGFAIPMAATVDHPDTAQQTGGAYFNVCDGDTVEDAVDWLATTGTGQWNTICLTTPTAHPSSIVVELDGTPVSRVSGSPGSWNGWRLDSGTNCVELYDDAVPEVGQTIDVTWSTVLTCD